MAEAHDLGLLRELYPSSTSPRDRRLDFIEHLHRLLIRAAVQRTLERAAGTRDRRIHIRQRRRRHPRRKGRGVEFMIGVENEDRVQHSDLPPAALRRLSL